MGKKEEMKATENKPTLDRRNFLKLAGVTTAIGATAGAITMATPAAALAAYETPASTGVNMSIKYLDTPPYNLPPYADADKLKPYNANSIPQIDPNFLDEETKKKVAKIPFERNKKGDPGFSLRDNALTNAAGATNYNPIMLDWRSDAKHPFPEKLGPWKDTPENNSLTVKKAAHYLGSGGTGICEINRQWVYTHYKTPIRFTDEVTVPVKTEKEALIPNSIKYAVVMLVPQDGVTGQFGPTLISGSPSGQAYSIMTELVAKVARFIRELGYNAIPCHNDTAMSVPLAIDAGLGELGRHGLLINPEFGSNMRICKVLTDMPLAPDKPITFGAAEFCRTCKKCAEMCPSKSIPMDDEPSYEVPFSLNNPGMKKWHTNAYNCYLFWKTNGASCSICQFVCTYSKPQTWVHDVIKTTASKTSMFNSLFAKLDDAFGYGKTINYYKNNAVEEWWSNPNSRNFNWRYM